MTTAQNMDLKTFIRDIPDYPKKGIIFKDITPLLADPSAFKYAIESMSEPFAGSGINKVVSIEARGFIFGAAISSRIGAGFVPVRKKGKLPYQTYGVSYQLEYGEDSLEMHQDAIVSGDKVLIVDDLLATGGTLAAAAELVSKFKAQVVGISCLIELSFLNGREKLAGIRSHASLKF